MRSGILAAPPLPGSSRPSISSSEAPPPVEIQSTESARPNLCSAATESPPPTTVWPGAAATASATARVPASNGGTSKAPIGPFQKTVPALAIRLAKLAVVLVPTSRPIQPSGTSTPFSSRVSVSASSSLPRTRSSGSSRIVSLFSASASTRFAASTPSSSTSELPVSRPSALKKLKHIAPPIRISSAKPRKRSITPSLSVTLAPPRTTISGRFGIVADRGELLDLLLEQQAGVAGQVVRDALGASRGRGGRCRRRR